MVCLGLEPGVAEWQVQMNPLSYGGTPISNRFICLVESKPHKQEVSHVTKKNKQLHSRIQTRLKVLCSATTILWYK